MYDFSKSKENIVEINGQQIAMVKYFKFLGIAIDEYTKIGID